MPGRCPPAARGDRGRPKRGCRGRTADLGPCRPGPTPAGPPRGSANVKIAQGKGNPEGNRREPEPGNGRREQPENAGRRETIRGRTTGTNLGGQTGNRRKARPGARRTTYGEAPDHPGESPGIWGRTHLRCRGRVRAGLREPRTAVHQFPGRQGPPARSRAPDAGLLEIADCNWPSSHGCSRIRLTCIAR
jgi:hypothetical protein